MSSATYLPTCGYHDLQGVACSPSGMHRCTLPQVPAWLWYSEPSYTLSPESEDRSTWPQNPPKQRGFWDVSCLPIKSSFCLKTHLSHQYLRQMMPSPKVGGQLLLEGFLGNLVLTQPNSPGVHIRGGSHGAGRWRVPAIIGRSHHCVTER